ncbi:D-glycero-beta-D-manno-heptose-7-phosphate kinase [Selenomonadales bacterium OttesenSCG-928-I06]|nr:D-glycero-beta-D-manno-heptose-7-phosphate kinase [Selenomonadales bacterium OttesenSCG-928-I06]
MIRNKRVIQDFLLNSIKKCKILVVGDVMLDRYYFSQVSRISPEAPVPIAKVIREKDAPGGAGNVAYNLAVLGCEVYLGSVVGIDDNRKRLLDLLKENNIDDKGLISLRGRPTTTKLRVMGDHQQMLRLDFEDSRPVKSSAVGELKRYISTCIENKIDAIIISDYGKGLCASNFCKYVIAEGNKANIPVVVDPKDFNWKKYSQASYITPNLKELGEVLRKSVKNDDKEVGIKAENLLKKFNLKGLVVTRSEKGLSLVTDDKKVHIPTLAQEVFDVSGAGDTVIAVFTAALAQGIEVEEAAVLANLAAGIVVAKIGTSPITTEELIESLDRCEV